MGIGIGTGISLFLYGSGTVPEPYGNHIGTGTPEHGLGVVLTDKSVPHETTRYASGRVHVRPLDPGTFWKSPGFATRTRSLATKEATAEVSFML